MILANYHTHTVFCDGKNTPEEMVKAAVSLGMTHLGFSGHSHVLGAEQWTMTPESEPLYRAEVLRLKDAYKDQIKIFLGLEQDNHSALPTYPYEYVIGSVHSLLKDGEPVEVDNTEAVMQKAVERLYGGDYYAYVKHYYETEARVAEHYRPTFIGHFDLVTKFNEGEKYFSESDPRYRKAALEALEAVAALDIPLEINTGAMSRGYRTVPYPAPFLLQAFHDMKGQILFSGDSHTTDSLLFGYDQAAKLALLCGYRTSLYLTEKGFEEAPIE